MSSKETVETSRQIDAWLGALVTLQPDLIIEGGTNNRPSLKNLVSPLLPDVPYVGLDLNPDVDFSGFTRFGNCFLPDQVKPIITRCHANKVALLSYNALAALLSNKINMWDRKDREDVIGDIKSAENACKLYQCQFHFGLGKSLWHMAEKYYRECLRLGYRVYDFGDRDLLVVTTAPIQSPLAAEIKSI